MSIDNQLSLASSLILRTHTLNVSTEVLDFYQIIGDLIGLSSLEAKYHQPLLNKVDGILHKLKPSATRFVFSHGDVNFHNILINRSKPYLIDWECCGLAEPEFDLAMCLSINMLGMDHCDGFVTQYQANAESITDSNDFNAINIEAHKINHYFEISNIINGLWYCGANVEIKEPDHQFVRQYFLDVLNKILLSL